MAPVAPSKRRSLRAKLGARREAQPHAPRKAARPDASDTSDAFINSKRDKRLVKHSSFISRIEKANKKPLKRRRPGKKLVTDLDSLRSALPDLLADGETEEGLQQMREGKVRMNSLRSRKGALKRKERLVKGEVQRFQASLARINAVRGLGSPVSPNMELDQQHGGPIQAADVPMPPLRANTSSSNATADRWAALRGFISATMERNPAFISKVENKG